METNRRVNRSEDYHKLREKEKELEKEKKQLKVQEAHMLISDLELILDILKPNCGSNTEKTIKFLKETRESIIEHMGTVGGDFRSYTLKVPAYPNGVI